MPSNSRDRSRKVRHVAELVNSQSGGMGKLLKQARSLQFLQKQLASLLEPEMASLVQVAVLRDGCLVLVTPSASLATRIRMDSNVLINSLRKFGIKGVSNIEIRVAPLPQTKRESRAKRGLPQAAKESMKHLLPEIK